MKLTAFDKNVENISALSDRPNIENGHSPKALKELFDKAGKDIKEYLNTVLIEELFSKDESACGADRIGSSVIESVNGETVQEKLISLAARINELANGTIPDGSVTPDKFSPEISAFLTTASIRAKVYNEPGDYTFTVNRGGTYKITVVGGGAGGGVDPAVMRKRISGGGGAGAILWKNLKSGDKVDITVGAGGEGLTVNTDSTFSEHAKWGESSVVKINSTTAVTAQGGSPVISERGKATGGTVNYSGSAPLASGYYSTSTASMEFCFGGDSILGRGAQFMGDEPSIGGGGFAGYNYGSGTYREGGKGGDGAVIIEYVQ